MDSARDEDSPIYEGPLTRRFELRAKLGEGGMGVVYRAWDRTLEKEVALKRVRDIDATRALQLKAEFRARSAVQHRNLVQLFDLVIDQKDCFFTMELVHGVNLAAWVRGGTDAEPPDEAPVTAATVMEGRDRLGEQPGRLRDQAPSSESGSGSARVRSSRRGLRALITDRLDADAVTRLREAVVELCTGLAVLHDARIVHRDVTPSNVRVAPDGRVVLLDFGLAEVAAQRGPASGLVIAGTPRYMAPEQIRGDEVTTAADLYAVGGIVYELVTGRAPFDGSSHTTQVAKATGERPLPIPDDAADAELAELAVALLDPEPAVRPTARDVLARLAHGGRTIVPTFGLPTPGDCIGREAEIAVVQEALARAHQARTAAVVVVEGPSGIGKTTVLRRVLDDAQTPRGALVLPSRCHPREIVPYKALDAAMDTLAAYASATRSIPPLPIQLAQAVARIFPALQALPAVGRHGGPAPVDEAEVRARAYQGLRELFVGLRARGPVVLCIDDVQWDDADSATLVEALLHGRDAPALVLLLGLRTDADEGAIVRTLRESRGLPPVSRVQLGPLGRHEVERIASAFLGSESSRVLRVVEESAGNPFIANALARYLAEHARTEPVPDDFQGLVAARLADLSPSERRLVAVSAVAAHPLPLSCALAAAGLGESARADVHALTDALLLRRGTLGAEESIAPYHDRIAEATNELLGADERAATHRAVAEALEARTPDDVDALYVHWEGAIEPIRAARYAVRAAERADEALAFGRAASLYEKAIALGYDGEDRASLFERAATAHANYGAGPAAAGRYLDASQLLGDDILDPRVRTLKRLAAEQYVESGHVRRGWEVMRSVLDAAHVPQPESPARAQLDALGRRLKFLARRVDVDAIGDRAIPENERARLEVLWTASTSMSMVNITLSDAFRTLYLERILDVGDRSSIARALAYEAALEAHVGGPFFDWHLGRLLGHAARLVERTGDPYDRAWLELGNANRAYCAGRFQEAVTACERSEQILRDECRGVAWEITTVNAFLLTSLAMRGDLPSLRQRAERFAVEADRGGDLFGIAEAYGGECALAWWSMGSGDDSLARARAAAAQQGGDAERWPEKTYRRGQLTELMATIHMELLAGRPWSALTTTHAHWPGLVSAVIPSLQFYRSWVRHGRARAAVAAARTLAPREERDGWTRASLLEDARAMRRAIARDSRPFGAPWAALIEGALAVARDDRAAAAKAVERAVVGFDQADMALYREAARARHAELTSAPHRRAEAEEWMRGRGVPDPRSLVEALAPGY